jgi:general secretion pathway protein A
MALNPGESIDLPPLTTAPDGRPLLDLFPVFFPSEIDMAAHRPPVPFVDRRSPPFDLTTDPKFLYHGAPHERGAQRLLHAIATGERMVVMTGRFGSGKTTLCRAVLEEVDRHTLTAFISEPLATLEGLLRALLIELGIASRDDSVNRLRGTSAVELLGTLRAFVAPLGGLNAKTVVIVDEAQSMPVSLLDELHALHDIDNLQLLLVGEPGLMTTLPQTSLWPLVKDPARRIELAPLDRDTIVPYLRHRLNVARRTDVIVDASAAERLVALSNGAPRLINLICGRILAAGEIEDSRLSSSPRPPVAIDRDSVERAAAGLGLTPGGHAPLGGRAAGLLAGSAAIAALYRFRTQLASMLRSFRS